jgi:hypothetical protein
MATYRGCNGKVKVKAVGATGGTVAVGELRNWSFTETSEQLDASAMGDCTKKFVAGAKETTGTIECWLDMADTTGQNMFVVGNAIIIEIYPNATGSTKPYYKTPTAGATVVSRNPDAGGVDGIVGVSFGFAVNGAMTATALP